MKLVKTYLQVSDLHFVGSLQRNLFDPWARHVPLLEGFVGHGAAPVRYLQRAWTRLRRAESNVELIVTGDLTAFGATDQFAAADAYFGDKPAAPMFLGLSQPHWAELSIPGNHDFWPGIAFVSLGWSNSEVRKRYPNDAEIIDTRVLANGRRIVFLCLNGDADVQAFSPERFYACGSFSSAIAQMQKLLAGRNPAAEIRVLLLHHPVWYKGASITSGRWAPLNLTLKHLTIDDSSRSALQTLINTHGIRVVLTGHVHRPFFVGKLDATFGFTHELLESCCGTTTQRNLKAPAPNAHNSLVVHRVYEDGASVQWASEVHTLQLNRSGFWVPAAPAPAASHAATDL